MWFIVAAAGGCALAAQAGANSMLAERMGSPVTAALTSFLIGALALAAATLVLRAPFRTAALQLPWWAWSGGLLGAVYVASVTASAPRIGAGAAVALVLVGQLTFALALDHFGLMGFARQALTLPKVLGLIAVVIGALLVKSS